MTRQEFMDFWRSEESTEILTLEDRLEIFVTSPLGESDLTVEIFNEMLVDYGATFRVKKDESF